MVPARDFFKPRKTFGIQVREESKQSFKALGGVVSSIFKRFGEATDFVPTIKKARERLPPGTPGSIQKPGPDIQMVGLILLILFILGIILLRIRGS